MSITATAWPQYSSPASGLAVLTGDQTASAGVLPTAKLAVPDLPGCADLSTSLRRVTHARRIGRHIETAVVP